jgi:hypothetical protein
VTLFSAPTPWFRQQAEDYSRHIEDRKDDRDVHDLGFLFWPTWRRWHEETGDPTRNDVVVYAGRTLAMRFDEKGRYLRSFLAPDMAATGPNRAAGRPRTGCGSRPPRWVVAGGPEAARAPASLPALLGLDGGCEEPRRPPHASAQSRRETSNSERRGCFG